MLSLPPEAGEVIVEFVNEKDVCRLQRVCKVVWLFSSRRMTQIRTRIPTNQDVLLWLQERYERRIPTTISWWKEAEAGATHHDSLTQTNEPIPCDRTPLLMKWNFRNPHYRFEYRDETRIYYMTTNIEETLSEIGYANSITILDSLVKYRGKACSNGVLKDVIPSKSFPDPQTVWNILITRNCSIEQASEVVVKYADSFIIFSDRNEYGRAKLVREWARNTMEVNINNREISYLRFYEGVEWIKAMKEREDRELWLPSNKEILEWISDGVVEKKSFRFALWFPDSSSSSKGRVVEVIVSAGLARYREYVWSSTYGVIEKGEVLDYCRVEEMIKSSVVPGLLDICTMKSVLESRVRDRKEKVREAILGYIRELWSIITSNGRDYISDVVAGKSNLVDVANNIMRGTHNAIRSSFNGLHLIVYTLCGFGDVKQRLMFEYNEKWLLETLMLLKTEMGRCLS